MNLCECGCGGQTTLNRAGQPYRFLQNHYQRTLKGRHAGYSVEDRGHSTPCWIWRGGRGGAKGDYGRMSVDGRNMPAHRFYYTQAHGHVPEGLELDHLCRVRLCVNPAHLEPVTPLENHRRAITCRLTERDVAVIKRELIDARAPTGRLPNGMYQQIASRYGVGKGAIVSVRKGTAWVDVQPAERAA